MRRRLTAREVQTGLHNRSIYSKLHKQALKQQADDQKAYEKHKAEQHASYVRECARQAREQEEWERDAPRRRAEEERRRVEQEREQAELRAREEKIEKERVAIFNEHVTLIEDASRLSAPDLKGRVEWLMSLTPPRGQYLYDAKEQGLPQSGDFNIFQAIFNNNHLSNQDRCDLLTVLLYQKGYQDYINVLLERTLIDKLSSDTVFDALLVRFKVEYANEDKKLVVLRAFVRINNDDFEFILKLFDELSDQVASGISVNGMMVLIKEWMSAISNSTDVCRAYQKLKSEYRDLRQLDSVIKKIAELRILEIEKKHQAEHKEECHNLGVSFNKDAHCSDTDSKKVKSFLKKSDYGFFKLCFSSKTPSTLDVYNMIQQDKPQAKEELSDKKNALEKEINTKVSKIGAFKSRAVACHHQSAVASVCEDEDEDKNFLPGGGGSRHYAW